MQKIINNKWEKVWISKYSFTNIAIFGWHYFQSCQKLLGFNFSKIIIIYDKGSATLYRLKPDNEKFSKKLSMKMAKDINFVKKYCQKLKKIIIKMNNSYFSKNINEKNSLKLFINFLKDYEKVTPLYIGIYWAANRLDSQSKQYKLLEETRKLSEPFFSKVESFLNNYFKLISEKHYLNIQQASSLFPEEILAILKGNDIKINKNTLNNRFNFSVLFFSEKSFKLILGSKAIKIKQELETKEEKQNKKQLIKENKVIKGAKAYGGLVRGEVQIVKSFNEIKKFKKNKILVTTSTRPDFLPAIKKAAAIVTEQGGILSHAAITARELKTPCIIGTKIATKALKDGDLVEVDAEKGIIKILKKAKNKK